MCLRMCKFVCVVASGLDDEERFSACVADRLLLDPIQQSNKKQSNPSATRFKSPAAAMGSP